MGKRPTEQATRRTRGAGSGSASPLLQGGGCMALLGLAAPLWPVAIAGLPLPPTPAPMPQLWASFQDDLLGDSVFNTDDYRTGGLRLNACFHPWDEPLRPGHPPPWYRRLGVVVAADYAVLTDRGHEATPESRSDETTLTAGLVWDEADWPLPGLRVLLAAGGGVRIDGDLGGKTVQNEIHNTFGYIPVLLPYGWDCPLAELGYAVLRTTWDVCALPLGHLALQPEAGGLATSHQERQSFAALSVAVLGSHGSAWTGGRYQWHSGDCQSPTALAVADHERGWWIDSGIGIAPGGVDGTLASWGLWMDAEVNPQTRAIDGTVGLMLGMKPGYAASTRDQAAGVVEAVLILPWDYGYGLRLDVPLRSPLEDIGCALALDYRHGGVGSQTWHDCELDYNQWTAGLEPSLACHPWTAPLAVRLYAHTDLGLRVEAVAVKGDTPRFTADHATTGVLMGGCGCALTWDWRGRSQADAGTPGILSLWCGYDWWWPFRHGELANGGDRADYLADGGCVVVGLGLSVAF